MTAAVLALFLLFSPAKPPTVHVTIGGKHLVADAVKMAKAADRVCDRTEAPSLRLVVQNKTTGSVHRIYVDCSGGTMSPATN